MHVFLKVLNPVSVVVDIAALKETIELKARQPQQLACLMVRKRSGPVAFDRQRLKRLTTGIGALDKIVGKLDGDLHTDRLPEHGRRSPPIFSFS